MTDIHHLTLWPGRWLRLSITAAYFILAIYCWSML